VRYAHDPVAYESEEWSRPDEMALFALLWRATRQELDARTQSRLLDVCCGSGMSLLGSAAHPHLKRALGVDLSHRLLDFARSRYSPFGHVAFVCADAVHAPFPSGCFDIVVASSAYHHIQPERKVDFLAECHRLLTPGGCVLMAENVLPSYDDEGEAYDAAVHALYDAVRRHAVATYPRLPASTRDMIDENVRLSVQRLYEYKVDRRRLLGDVRAAGFAVERETGAWPSQPDSLEPQAGNVLFVLRKPAA
jgi:ubiquinone/menaquinone biosynthesis C-methylase UbiE